MKKATRLLCLMLCLILLIGVLPTAAYAADYINKITVTVTEPTVGDEPANAKTSSTASTEVIKTEWSGELDENGRFKANEQYTITVTVGIKEEYDEKYFRESTNAKNYTINGNNATVVSHSRSKVVLSYTFKNIIAVKEIKSYSIKVTAPQADTAPKNTSVSNDRCTCTIQWLGNFNSDGTFKVGEQYTAQCIITAIDPAATKLLITSGDKLTINGYPSEMLSSSEASVTFQYRFAPVAPKVATVANEDGEVGVAQFFYAPAYCGEKPVYDVSVSQSDTLTISNVAWSGTFDENGCFIAKNTYRLSFVVTVKDGVDLTIPKGSIARKYTVNGSPLSVGTTSNGGKTFSASTNVTVELPPTVTDITKVFTLEQADAVENTLNGEKYRDLILDNDTMKKYIEEYRLVTTWYPVDEVLYLDNSEIQYVTRLLVDYPADNDSYDVSGKALDFLCNLTELWLSPDMNVEKWLDNIASETLFSYDGSDRGPNTWDFTVYISSEKYPNGWKSKYGGVYSFPFRIQLYDGDVYTAFEKAGQGEKVGRDWCTKHEYTVKMTATDRVMEHATCQNATWYCYSCAHCGKPERNINHVFKTYFRLSTAATDVTGRIEHSMTQVIDAKHLVGKNADGDLVYAESCVWCGANEMQVTLVQDMTEAQFKYYYGDNGLSLKEYQVLRKEAWDKSILPQVLASTIENPQIGYFVVAADKVVTAKTASWATGEVNWAAQNDLLDAALLGNDYTKTITRLQFCSLAVRLAERMLGREITPAASTFTDTDNIYVLKAVAAGITTGTSATTFSPNNTLTREQMATFIYRALMYVRNNSATRYTVYESKLGAYTDSKSISSYATDPMAFLNALGIIKGKTDTTLVPKGTCTIQEAILVAYRSLSADKIGWYQCVDWYWDGVGYFIAPDKDFFIDSTYVIGDRVWVNGAVEDIYIWLKIDSPASDYTNTPMYVRESDFKPIKDLLPNDVEMYNKYVQN